MPARIAKEVEARVREAARNRCGYCLADQEYTPVILEIEHIIPTSKGGSNEENNLWLACPRCNSHKSDQTVAKDPQTGQLTALFNPRTQAWFEHFKWSDDGTIVIGLTDVGRTTVAALKINSDPRILKVRRNWVLAGWHPPSQ